MPSSVLWIGERDRDVRRCARHWFAPPRWRSGEDGLDCRLRSGRRVRPDDCGLRRRPRRRRPGVRRRAPLRQRRRPRPRAHRRRSGCRCGLRRRPQLPQLRRLRRLARSRPGARAEHGRCLGCESARAPELVHGADRAARAHLRPRRRRDGALGRRGGAHAPAHGRGHRRRRGVRRQTVPPRAVAARRRLPPRRRSHGGGRPHQPARRRAQRPSRRRRGGRTGHPLRRPHPRPPGRTLARPRPPLGVDRSADVPPHPRLGVHGLRRTARRGAACGTRARTPLTAGRGRPRPPRRGSRRRDDQGGGAARGRRRRDSAGADAGALRLLRDGGRCAPRR